MNLQSLPTTQSDTLFTPYVANTAAVGCAVAWCFGPVAGVCAAVAHVAIAQLNQNHVESYWYPLEDKTIEQLKDYWKDSSPFFITRIALSILARCLGWVKASSQMAVQWLVSSLASPWTAVTVIFQVAVVAPLVEETIFRGFLQEKIRDIQAWAWGSDCDTLIHKVVRVALQACVFAWAHYHPSQGLFNIPILLITGFLGVHYGALKEDVSNLWSSTASHAHFNASGVAQIAIMYV
jgi:membrane protease YdiL (CAAX protease family)